MDPFLKSRRINTMEPAAPQGPNELVLYLIGLGVAAWGAIIRIGRQIVSGATKMTLIVGCVELASCLFVGYIAFELGLLLVDHYNLSWRVAILSSAVGGWAGPSAVPVIYGIAKSIIVSKTGFKLPDIDDSNKDQKKD